MHARLWFVYSTQRCVHMQCVLFSDCHIVIPEAVPSGGALVKTFGHVLLDSNVSCWPHPRIVALYAKLGQLFFCRPGNGGRMFEDRVHSQVSSFWGLVKF